MTIPCTRSISPRVQALCYFMSENHLRGGGRASSEQLSLEVAVRRQTSAIYQFIPTIIILAATAPLLGLFGTVFRHD